jgi:hypothetical protein
VTLLIPAGAFDTVFPDSDSKSVALGPELLFQICNFFIFPGKLTNDNPYRNCEICCDMNLHSDDSSREDVMQKNGHTVELSFNFLMLYSCV